jgi:hypothetical protein
MTTLNDMWGNDVEITQSYVSHRNRLVDVNLIHTFHAKGKKLLINTYKQNDHVPTMCIFFENKEMAEEAYQVMKNTYYGETNAKAKALVVRPVDMEFSWEILLALTPLVAMLFYLFSKHFLPLK